MPNTTIQLKKSSTPSAKPADLANGELAINFADGKLYYKNTTSSIVEITPTQSSSFGTVSANGVLLVADTVGDVLTIASGNNINIATDAVSDRLTIGVIDNPRHIRIFVIDMYRKNVAHCTTSRRAHNRSAWEGS